MLCRNVSPKKLLPVTGFHTKYCCYFDAIPDGNVGFVTAGCTFAAHLKHQKGIFRPRAVSFSRENSKEKSPKNGLFKPFFGLLSLAKDSQNDTNATPFF